MSESTERKLVIPYGKFPNLNDGHDVTAELQKRYLQESKDISGVAMKAATIVDAIPFAQGYSPAMKLPDTVNAKPRDTLDD